jgi:hypothetical protein
MALRHCIFCRSTGNLTREHVFPGWLQRRVRPLDATQKNPIYRGTHLSSLGMRKSVRQAGANSHTYSAVCAECNNGWMSELEQQFAVLLDRMILKLDPLTFSKKESRTIALWVTKTCILMHKSSNYRKIIPEKISNLIGKGASIPKNIYIFGGTVIDSGSLYSIQTNFRLVFAKQDRLSKIDLFNNNIVIAIKIQNIFLGFAWHDYENNSCIFQSDEKTCVFYPHPVRNKQNLPITELYDAPNGVYLKFR